MACRRRHWKTSARIGADIDTKLQALEDAKKVADSVKQKEDDDKKFAEDQAKKTEESATKAAIKFGMGVAAGVGCGAIPGVGVFLAASCGAYGAMVGDLVADQAWLAVERQERNRPAALEAASKRYPPGTCHYAMGSNFCTK
ncbi:hypothetical protein E1263_00565 [Kribbella antibiotica]|uniref:Uncharacterized protein n=1 Tax=Kribbella antibiotica TaxID=190195 RepID=A0A4V2YQU3_9ACTN|nr:hypothetical protein [Kribbella antibiotica]TDD63477.1 hypothetical protein E1263_00565 [Kribbella antibiotica]